MAARECRSILRMSPHPENQAEWFRRLPLERQVEMSREHEERLQRPLEIEAVARRRMRIEALWMGGVFALFAWMCSSFLGALVAAVLGTALGWVCSRLDLKRLSTAALGMAVFSGSQYLLNSSSVFIILVFPLGAACALLGWTREERGT